jgi:PAS domain S-box-containing protein
LKEIRRLNRLYSVLSQVNQAVIKSSSRDEFLREVCRVAVESGGLKVAWIGRHDPETGGVVPLATWGAYPAGENTILVWADERPEGRGPTGRALRTGRPVIARRLEHPSLSPWHELFRNAGVHSAASFPIELSPDERGCLSVYAVGRDFFRRQEVRLLEEVATAVGFALANLHKEAQRAEAGRALRESEQRFRLLADNATDIIWTMNTAGRFTYVSPAVRALRGYSPEEAMAQTLDQILVPESAAIIKQALASSLLPLNQGLPVAPRRFELQMKCKNGSVIWTEVTVGPMLDRDGAFVGFVGVTRDITKRREAEAALDESREFARRMTEVLPSVLYIYDIASRSIVHSNREVISALGHSPEQVRQMGRDFVPRTMHPDDFRRFPGHIARVCGLPAGGVTFFEYRMRHADGGWRWFFSRDSVFSRDGHGTPLQIIGTATDITERKVAEEELEEQRRFISAVARNSPDIILVYDLERKRHVYRNRDFREILDGLPRESCGEQDDPLLGLMHPDDTVRLLAQLDELAQSSDGGVASLEYRIRTKNGDCAWFLARNSVFKRDGGGRVLQILNVSQNISERKRAEETRLQLGAQLRQAQKMEAVGELAGGVAHDFNNLLTVILGNSSLLLEDAALGAETRELIRQIADAAERGSNLTRQLLTFSRRHVMQIRRLNLNMVLANLRKMLDRLLGDHIQVELECEPDLPEIAGDICMLEQVVVNLVVNSRDAMPGGGTVRIRTWQEILGAEQTRVNPESRCGTFACLSVRDTGRGMDPDTLRRIFEPFFTTKEVGRGTGLGLATVYGIVKQHDGWVEVTSEPGKGTSFRVFLPANGEEVECERPGKEEAEALQGSETILVVEDETDLRRMARTFLERCGYQVIEAGNGKEALRIWQSDGEKIDLLLTDLVMPEGLSGRQLAERLRSERSSLKVVYTSGYSGEVLGADSELLTDENYLAKPYTLSALAQAVRRRLDR